ncbi:hypothetical protein [Notoacmeibacter ruber]|uniref:DNA transposition protein n=1 Tax=Notoacmeibacter ruber TaxID=2670375 RepID=A0A3L7JEK0_9HYPH|nr:hypothetical protein [Notoacmeibacter ruber]RLQ88884.1 hypothetical protein D8780_12275 [Notoacmeibacter ruber]
MTRRDLLTPDLFDWQPPEPSVGYSEDVTGKGTLDLRIARILSRALEEVRDERGLSRGEVASKIGDYLDRVITKQAVDDWTSAAKPDRRIRLDEFAALIAVTGKYELLGLLPEMFGFAVVSDRYCEIIRNHEMNEQRKKIADYQMQLDAQIAASDARLRGKGGRR